MATDKLMNQSQGADIVTALQTIAQKSQTPYNTDNKLNTQYTVLTGYSKASSAESVGASDSVPTALGKLEYKTDINQTNILSIQDHYKYDNRTLFEQEAIPTGTITDGSTWIDGDITYQYKSTTNIVGGMIEQGSWTTPNIGKIDSNTRCRLSNSISLTAGNTYTITVSGSTITGIRVLLQYRNNLKTTVSESGWQSTLPYTFTVPSNASFATILLSKTGDIACVPSEFGKLQINTGSTALTYGEPSWQSTLTTITPALVECVNNGAKNLAPLNSASASATGYFATTSLNLPAGDYIMSYKLTTPNTFEVSITVDGSAIAKNFNYPPYNNTLITHEITANTGITEYKFYANGSATVTDFMICPKSLYDADPTYQPYAMSNVELTEDVTSLEKRACKSANTSSNTILELSATDIPASARGAYLLSIPFQGDTRAPTLYYILFIGEFVQAYELIGGTNSIVTAVTVKQSKIYFTCSVATWTPPVLLPLIREANAPTINMQWVSSIPT